MTTAKVSWKDSRVLVTGATGIVGSWLVKDLVARGAYVVALVRDADPQSEFYRSEDYRKVSIVSGKLEDIWDIERALNEHEIDTVFHLAAQAIVGVAHRHPLQTFESNIRGTYNLLEACRWHRGQVKRVVIASSDKAYGTQKQLPYVEEMPLQGKFPYEVSKSCADLIAQTYFHTYEMPVAIARCGNIFGGGDLNWSRIVPGTIKALLRNERPIIRSDGKYIRDYIYVKDVVSGYLRLAEELASPQVAGEGFNFSPEKAMSVLELVEQIQQVMGKQSLKADVQNTAQGEIRSQFLNAAKSHQLLGWKPAHSLPDALRETVSWYSDFFGRSGGEIADRVSLVGRRGQK